MPRLIVIADTACDRRHQAMDVTKRPLRYPAPDDDEPALCAAGEGSPLMRPDDGRSPRHQPHARLESEAFAARVRSYLRVRRPMERSDSRARMSQ